MSDASALQRCLATGGVAVFPADTVYGLACAPGDAVAVQRLYRLKGRAAEKPAAVMFFTVASARRALPELDTRTAGALERLLPGALTLLIANPARRFGLACGKDPTTLGLRVPALPALASVTLPALQSSANRAGEPDARRLADVPEAIRAGADLVLDGGELPGTASTVVDLRRYSAEASWRVVRAGAVAPEAVARALDRGGGAGR